MTFVAQLRPWLKESSATERAMTAVATAVVMALLAWALVPAPAEGPAGLLNAGSGAEAGVALDGGAAGATDAGGSARTGAILPGARSTVTDGRSAGRGAPSGSAPTDRLTTTDRGVSAEAIKVGFAVVNFESANRLGIYPDLREDASEAIDAFVDYANKRGGVLGRRIQPVKVNPDLTNAEDQRRRCVELTETHGVFAVVTSFAFSSETATACITAEHKTLLVSGNPGSSENVRLGFPYHVSVLKDDNRKMKDLVAGAKAAGFFDPARGFEKLGIFGDDCGASATIFDSPTDGLKAYLSAAGVKEWSEFRIDCAVAVSPHGSAQAVVKFQDDDVTHVLLAAHPPVAESYLKAAGSARYYPKYFSGDYLNLAAGPFTKTYEPEGFDGALGVTQTHAGEGAIGKPLPPLTRTCSKILTDHRLAPVSSASPNDIGDDLEILSLCESFLLFLQVATAAGPDLTRATWVNALAGVGDYRGAFTDLARFDRPGKMTGGDTMKLIKWHKSCTCWKELTGFQPAAG